MSEQKEISLKKAKTASTKRLIAVIIGLLAFFYISAFWSQEWTVPGSRVSPLTILYRMFVVPFTSLEYLQKFPERILEMLETIAIAYAGGIAASIIAMPIAFLASRNIGGPLSYIGKAILNAIRSIPSIIFAILFVAALGVGPYPGVLAISINSIGMLGKLYAEVIESIDMNMVDAIRASGGNRVQAVWYGVFPQVLPDFASFSIYRFEIDVRASTVLGLVGAGGIGVPLMIAQQQRNWEDVGIILIIVIVFVTLIDKISGEIREKLV
ncbi:phosphonate transport system permease protein [Alkalibacterium subtropicum]|uniref:Phosphonate transport system permease protein n=1 Tax=Alkalibacterium subtropicum TaxID=753702 RepID=A0A1I1L466_9LACT|nr:phosphonate ABC transporter, permease protein PhnE [Alkalibacterium subtropicum]SFC64390.1 phosphonate transport system permease protein [Alkalibacterium subtropicum]